MVSSDFVWPEGVHPDTMTDRLFDVPTSDPVEIVFNLWVETMRADRKVQPALTKLRRRKINWAVETYGLDTCLAAVRGCANSDFHMGRNSQRQEYNDIELIFRDAQRIEKFAELGQDTDDF